jgi:hypothetical protein
MTSVEKHIVGNTPAVGAPIGDQLAGLTLPQQRRRLRAMAGKGKVHVATAAPVVAVGPSPAVLALRVPCSCRKCQKRLRWPMYYLVREYSYECVLEMAVREPGQRGFKAWQYDGNNEREAYLSTSDSPSAPAFEYIRKNRIRIYEGLAMRPEEDSALKYEIALRLAVANGTADARQIREYKLMTEDEK